MTFLMMIRALHADEVFYSEYSPHNGSLYINHELQNHTTLQIRYIQLLSKYPEFTLYSIRNQERQEIKKIDLIDSGNKNVQNRTETDIAQYIKTIEELEMSHTNAQKELEKTQLMLNETQVDLQRIKSDLAACITISAGFQNDYNQLSEKYTEIKMALPSCKSSSVTFTNGTSSSSSFLSLLQWNYTSCIQELNRCKKKISFNL